MNNTENKRDEFDLALEDMKMETEVDLDRLIEKRVKQMMVRTSLKVVLLVLLIVALVFLGAGFFGGERTCDTQVDNSKVEQIEPDQGIIKLNGGMSYKYSLPAYTEDGAEVNVAFGTERELTEGRYLKLQERPIQGVISWQEVRFDELPPVVQEAYRR